MIPIPILFFSGEKIKIDPKLSFDERKKFIRKTLKHVWLETAITFFIGEIILFFMFYKDILSGDTSLSVVIITELMLVLASVLLCVLDGVKLILQNRKINKQQKERIQLINSKRAEDPLIGAKMGAEEIWHKLLKAFTENDGRLNATILMLWTSGLAGCACQLSAWEKAEITGESPEILVFTAIDGRNFYTGDAINAPLITNEYSVWHLAAGMYHELEPTKPLPDIDNLVGETITMLTEENYKMWGQINPHEMLNGYKHVWDNAIKNTITDFCKDPDEWPILFGYVLQKTIQLVIKIFPSDQSCLEMIMRNALFTSRLDIMNATPQNPAR